MEISNYFLFFAERKISLRTLVAGHSRYSFTFVNKYARSSHFWRNNYYSLCLVFAEVSTVAKQRGSGGDGAARAAGSY